VQVEVVGVSRSALDEARFGFRVARVERMTLELLPRALEFCARQEVRFLMANCRSSERRTVQAMEQQGFELMDTTVCWERDLTQPLAPFGGALIRTVRTDEAETLAAAAAEAFRQYVSHYLADPRLDPARSAEVYPDWVRRTCLGRDAENDVMVAEVDGKIASFILMKLLPDAEAIYPLAGVIPEMRRHNVVRNLSLAVLAWGRDRGAKRGLAQIQLDNVPMQRAMIQIGFLPRYSFFIFHKWFDR